MFIWVGILAAFFLKEKINRRWQVAALLLLIGNVLLLGLDKVSLGWGELLVLLATLLWAAENILSKHALGSINPRLVAWARMFFGAIFMLVYLGWTGQTAGFLELNSAQLSWILLTSGLLFLYVTTWYTGLAEVEVSAATCILLLGSPVTSLLSMTTGSTITLAQSAGILLLLSGVVLVIGFSHILKLIKGISFTKSEG
jgi:drug/metabolite transporter (DMT)-like permease